MKVAIVGWPPFPLLRSPNCFGKFAIQLGRKDKNSWWCGVPPPDCNFRRNDSVVANLVALSFSRQFSICHGDTGLANVPLSFAKANSDVNGIILAESFPSIRVRCNLVLLERGFPPVHCWC